MRYFHHTIFIWYSVVRGQIYGYGGWPLINRIVNVIDWIIKQYMIHVPPYTLYIIHSVKLMNRNSLYVGKSVRM